MKIKMFYPFSLVRSGLVTLGLVTLSAGVGHATVVQIDFSTGSSAVQPGFVAQTSGAATTYSTVTGDITVASTGSFFNRSAGGAYDDAALLGDFTFLNSFGTMTLTIAGPGISANTAYDMTFWSLDSHHGTTGGTVTYAGSSGTVGGTSIAYSTSNTTAGNSSSTSFISNGSGELVINVTGTNEGPRVSGLAITVVPEPSAALLGGLGALFLLPRRR